MDLKQQHHDDGIYRVRTSGGIGHSGSHVMIKPEPRVRASCLNQPREMVRGYPTVYDPHRLFNGIAAAKRELDPDDWLSPNAPISLVTSHNHNQDTNSNLNSRSTSSPSATNSLGTSTSITLSIKNHSASSSPSSASTSSTIPVPTCHPPPVMYPNTSGFSSPLPMATSYDPCSPPSVKLNREDLSPNSQNGYMIEGYDMTKKKKASSGSSVRQQEELCLVCGDRASGYHYNALTCEGCKGFFRRSITKNAVYQCKYGNHCDIDMYMRRKCQECRLKKCLSVGMRPECVVPEFQCAVKRKEKKAQRDKDKPSTTGSPESIKTEPDQKMDQDPPSAGLDDVKPISPEQEELIHSLVFYQEQYEQPSEEDLQRVMQDVQNASTEREKKFRHITGLTFLTVQLIVEFAKTLPGFDKLLREDQITLLKACSSEVMMLRMARKYDVNTDSIIFANNELYSKDSYGIAGMADNVEDHWRFCRQMCVMKVDNAEYALLTAIVIFSGRPSLMEEWKVEKIQEIYVEALKAYVENRIRPNATVVFARLLSVLTELRTLGNRNSEACFALKLKSRALPPFLSEIWDVP